MEIKPVSYTHLLAVFAVARDQISDKTWSEIRVAELGNSNISVAGDVVIALGGTFGYAEGTGYGIISSNNYKEVFSDGECEVIATDISADVYKRQAFSCESTDHDVVSPEK